MPSAEFARICRDLSNFGESICIACTKEGIKFYAAGDIGTANIKVCLPLLLCLLGFKSVRNVLLRLKFSCLLNVLSIAYKLSHFVSFLSFFHSFFSPSSSYHMHYMSLLALPF